VSRKYLKPAAAPGEDGLVEEFFLGPDQEERAAAAANPEEYLTVRFAVGSCLSLCGGL
jgi:hypothetical protein